MSDTVEEEDFERNRTQFYAVIGHCVTRYQAMEDYLPKLFAAAARRVKPGCTVVKAVHGCFHGNCKSHS